MAQAFAGLILAGGLGERFGRPKALAQLPDGRTFLAACAATLAEAGAHPVAATLPHGSPDPAISGLFAAPLPADGLDMLDSARFGLAALLQDRWDAVVLWPVDHPLVGVAAVRALVAADARVAVPVFRGKRGHPVRLSRSTASRLVARDLPGLTLRDVLAAAGRTDVEVADAGVVANCNTPERLAEALAGR